MISVVIPVLDEETAIGAALERLRGQGEPHQVIVADGGSGDATAAVAAAHGARVVTSPTGRGTQMNAGAREATGDALVFLHVDVRLPEGALAAIAAALADVWVCGGGFRKRYDGGGWILGATAAVLNAVRTERGRRLVGTQAIFVRRDVFERLGGYREWPLLEDVDFSDRLRTAGEVRVLPLEVVASSRRYRRRGVLRQVLLNAAVLGLFRLGVGPERLKRLYEGWSEGR